MLKKQLNYPSITLLALPYFIYYLPGFLESNLFKAATFTGYLGTLILIDVLIRSINTNSKFKWIADFIIWIICFYIFYGLILSEKIQSIIISQLDVVIRGRLLLSIGLFALIFGAMKLKPKKYFIVNTFLFILITANIINSGITLINKTQKENIVHYSKFIPKNKFEHYSKPIILIILDEYSSPNELFKLTKDSSLFEFSKSLERNNWEVRNNSFSYETSTIHSLGSIFNYNLSNNTDYSKLSTNNVSEYFINPQLINDLEVKAIKVINFGIFKLKEIKPLTRLYFYPQNETELIFQYSAIYHFINNTNLSIPGVKLNYYPIQSHNKWLFDNLVDSVNSINEPSFIYTHFYMPHGPIQYFNEFVSVEKNRTLKYIEYWKFTNKKIKPLLEKLGNHYRIILTGDHGFRKNKKINAHKTFSAFLGFTKKELINIKSVQDFGILAQLP
jgi:voltage-gated potassium channel Kch